MHEPGHWSSPLPPAVTDHQRSHWASNPGKARIDLTSTLLCIAVSFRSALTAMGIMNTVGTICKCDGQCYRIGFLFTGKESIHCLLCTINEHWEMRLMKMRGVCCLSGLPLEDFKDPNAMWSSGIHSWGFKEFRKELVCSKKGLAALLLRLPACI